MDNAYSQWGMQLSQLLSALGQSQYDWATQQFNSGQGITNDNIARYIDMSGKGAGLANTLISQYKDVFKPIMDQYVQQAGTYNSEARQRFEMGKAESTVGQANTAARDAAERKLQSFGINPNSGRYQDLTQSTRIADAAARAGAGTQASLNTAAAGRQMTRDAAVLGQNVPGMAVNALQSAYSGVGGAQNALLGMQNAGVNLKTSAAPYFNAASGALKLPPVGNQTQSSQQGQGSSTQGDGSGASGRGSGGGGGGGGDRDYGRGGGSGYGGNDYGRPGPSSGADAGMNLSGLRNGWALGGSARTMEVPEDNNWGNNYSDYVDSGDFFDYTDSGDYTGGDNRFADEAAWDQPDDNGSSPYGWEDNSPWSADTYAGSNYTDYMDSGDYFDDTSGGEYSAGGDSNYTDYMDSGDYDSGGGDDSWYDESDESFARGGGVLPTTGGRVPRSASPSRGRQTDDIPARLNAGEYVIPRDVVTDKGHEFFRSLIEKSRRNRTGMSGPAPKAKMKPALRMRPSFVSREMYHA